MYTADGDRLEGEGPGDGNGHPGIDGRAISKLTVRICAPAVRLSGAGERAGVRSTSHGDKTARHDLDRSEVQTASDGRRRGDIVARAAIAQLAAVVRPPAISGAPGRQTADLRATDAQGSEGETACDGDRRVAARELCDRDAANLACRGSEVAVRVDAETVRGARIGEHASEVTTRTDARSRARRVTL